MSWLVFSVLVFGVCWCSSLFRLDVGLGVMWAALLVVLFVVVVGV